MFTVPANCPTTPVIIGAILTVVGWPATAWLAYRSGFRSQRMRMEWEAQKAKQSQRQKFFDLANDLKVSTAERPDNWIEIFKEKAAHLVSNYEMIRSDLAWKEKRRIDEAMNTIKRFAVMDHDDIHAACGNDSELFDALKKFPET
ncbi:MAG TPA: hypothetical protein VGY56_10015 [Verrucomicrobiae bacterium]|nr:hypothetical protein [Verrucomicrobiae bacterium]